MHSQVYVNYDTLILTLTLLSFLWISFLATRCRLVLKQCLIFRRCWTHLWWASM